MTAATLQTLDRGIETLLMVARTPAGLRMADLTAGLGLNRAAAYRIVATLTAHGMVRRLQDGRIVLGSGAYLLGAQVVDGLRAAARPVLDRLAEDTGATAFLSMADRDDCVVALTAEPRNAGLNIQYRIGTRHPLTLGAAGLAILSARPETPQDSDGVRLARAQGFSLTRGQLYKGAVGVSSPVVLPDQGFAGMECSLGVVSLESLDVALACRAVPDAAQALAAWFR